jgi:NAD+ kinase
MIRANPTPAAQASAREAIARLPVLGVAAVDTPAEAELIVTFGGDGTLLHHAAAANGVPVLGVNMGRRGYLCALERDELSLLDNVFLGEYRVERRMMLDVRIVRDGAVVQSAAALNDAVIARSARMVSLSLHADGNPLLSFAGDGVILSTPTGSTAYSMAAGGPILEPEANALLITPICAHEIFARPLVLSPERVVSVAADRGDAQLSIDGGEPFSLRHDDRVDVSRSAQVVYLAQIKPTGFYGLIYDKFHR